MSFRNIFIKNNFRSNSYDNKADKEMMPKELQVTKNSKNELNSENPVSPKVLTELKPSVREGTLYFWKILKNLLTK